MQVGLLLVIANKLHLIFWTAASYLARVADMNLRGLQYEHCLVLSRPVPMVTKPCTSMVQADTSLISLNLKSASFLQPSLDFQHD